MKLRNKKTGEIIEWENPLQYKLGKEYHSIKEFVEEWEDAPKDPKNVYFISSEGIVFETYDEYYDCDWENEKQIGNYFETREEADKAVEKLKAWKRLKDKGFRFAGWKNGKLEYPDYVSFDCEDYKGCKEDLDIVFGGEE